MTVRLDNNVVRWSEPFLKRMAARKATPQGLTIGYEPSHDAGELVVVGGRNRLEAPTTEDSCPDVGDPGGELQLQAHGQGPIPPAAGRLDQSGRGARGQLRDRIQRPGNVSRVDACQAARNTLVNSTPLARMSRSARSLLPKGGFTMSPPLYSVPRSMGLRSPVACPVAWCVGRAGFFERTAIFPGQFQAQSRLLRGRAQGWQPAGGLVCRQRRAEGRRRGDRGSRLGKGKTAWGPKFLLADTPGYPDCNPALFAAPDGSLWLFWPTILDHRWEGALLKFARSRPSDGRAGRLEMVVVGGLARHAQRFRRRRRAGDRRPERRRKGEVPQGAGRGQAAGGR